MKTTGDVSNGNGLSVPVLVAIAIATVLLAWVLGNPPVGVLAILPASAAVFVYVSDLRDRAKSRRGRKTTAFGQSASAEVATPAQKPQISQPPLERPAPPAPCPEFSVPQSLEPAGVVHSLFANAGKVCEVVAAHLWVVEPSSDTLRLVAAEGPMAPAPIPVRPGDDLMGQAISTGVAVFAAHHRVSTADDQLTVWRYAVPVNFENEVGVAALDLESNCTPLADNINLLFAQMRLALTAALALYVARARTESAHAVLEASRDLSRTLDPDRVIADALDRAMSLADAATGSVMLLDADGRRLEMRTARGLPNRVSRSTTLAVGEGIAGWVAASGQPLLVEDLPGTASRGQRHGVRSAVSVPIADEDGLLGVLNVGSRSYPARFTENHLEALEAIGKQTAIALRNAWAVTSAGEMFFDTLKALALALETKDPYASGGTERMLELSTALGKALHLTEADQRAIEIAAMLHDLGMGAMGDGVASTARPLSTVERGLLKMHPVIAADVLDQAPALKAVVPIVYHHHEHYDGTGYAGGLAGETIPLGARMLSVVDAYVAMTSDRPYRQALTPQQALKELREKAGSQFDPDVVEVFASIVDREGQNANDRSL